MKEKTEAKAPHVQIDQSTSDDTNKETISILYPDKRFSGSRAACPDDDNVERAKHFVEENQK